MTEIAEIHDRDGAAFPPEGHPVVDQWVGAGRGLIIRVAAEMQARKAHPSRTVVLLPYGPLVPLARQFWASQFPDGYAPRFETSLRWGRSMHDAVGEPTDLTLDVATDVLTARELLVAAGMADQAALLTGHLVMAAHQLAGVAAARPAGARAAWLARSRHALGHAMDVATLDLEAMVMRIALEWVARSAYATDALLEESVRRDVDCLVVAENVAPEPLIDALAQVWGGRMARIPLALSDPDAPAADRIAAVPGPVFHRTLDVHDEAMQAAACVVRHASLGHTPVALVALDRTLTRRISAMLLGCGLSLRDENGWKLSTSRAGAQVMALLRACVWDAGTDDVLAWLKLAPAFEPGAVRALEKMLRKEQIQNWRTLATRSLEEHAGLVAGAQEVLEQLRKPRQMGAWTLALRDALVHCGVLEQWATDVAGQKVLSVLRLQDPPSGWTDLLATAPWAQRSLDLASFTAWVGTALESASFMPQSTGGEQVVVLPMNQVAGRPFAATVIPGCDEVRLHPSQDPPGLWTAGQRELLGLPTRTTLERSVRGAWSAVLLTPHCDVLWRTSDEGVETLLPSPLVQRLLATAPDAGGKAGEKASACLTRPVVAAPVHPPVPQGHQLEIRHLSASGYEDLRHCPYRFFALRQLGLRESDELQSEPDKRDFGTWLHDVLRRFHLALQEMPSDDVPVRRHMLDTVADEVTAAMLIEPSGFLPFAAAWPAVRDGYLHWLQQHEAAGLHFDQAEVDMRRTLDRLLLVGKIDRIDRQADGTPFVVDYKTESQTKAGQRIKAGSEDTQLAFYAALLASQQLRAAYVTVGEKEAARTFEQPDVATLRDQLLEGLRHDMQGIAAGAALPALGEGVACDFCAARGLCRKDFWSPAPTSLPSP